MPETAPQEQFSQDLGLGGKLSERSRVWLVNHDGTFNVRRNDLSPFHPYNVYHTLLSHRRQLIEGPAASPTASLPQKSW